MTLSLDLTASAASNLVSNETTTVTSSQISSNGLVFLKNGLFYANGLSITLTIGTTTKQLVAGTDYWLVGLLKGVAAIGGGAFAAILVNSAW